MLGDLNRLTGAGHLQAAQQVRDLWSGQRRSIADGFISAGVEGNGVAMLRLK